MSKWNHLLATDTNLAGVVEVGTDIFGCFWRLGDSNTRNREGTTMGTRRTVDVDNGLTGRWDGSKLKVSIDSNITEKCNFTPGDLTDSNIANR